MIGVFYVQRTTAVTRQWNGYQNKSQHRKRNLEKKFSRHSCRESNPRPFDHESGALTTELFLFPPTADLMQRNGHRVPSLLFSKSAVYQHRSEETANGHWTRAFLYTSSFSGSVWDQEGIYYYYYWSLFYSAILRFRADSLRSHVILHE